MDSHASLLAARTVEVSAYGLERWWGHKGRQAESECGDALDGAVRTRLWRSYAEGMDDDAVACSSGGF